MTIELDEGLFREILTKPVKAEDQKFNIFSVTNEAYTTYINIGIWKDLESFDRAMEQYITTPEKRVPINSTTGEEKLTLYFEDFEFKIRERIVLQKVNDRDGLWDFQSRVYPMHHKSIKSDSVNLSSFLQGHAKNSPNSHSSLCGSYFHGASTSR
jgi:hypothetical protein